MSSDITPTKTHRGENFPVASLLIAPRHRATILAFYRFVRAADDVADSPVLSAPEKIARRNRDLFLAWAGSWPWDLFSDVMTTPLKSLRVTSCSRLAGAS